MLRGAEINLSPGPLRIRARKNRMRSARLGLVVSKKGNPKAVRRNRIKRVIREQFRRHARQLPAVDIVIQVFAPVDDEKLMSMLQRGFGDIRRHFADQAERGQ